MPLRIIKWTPLRTIRLSLGKQGWITTIVILLLAVGLGGGGALLATALYVARLPVPTPNRLFWLRAAGTSASTGFDPNDLSTVRSLTSQVDLAGGYIPASRRGRPDFMLINGRRHFLATVQASPQMFQLLGDQVAVGRSFSEQEANPFYNFFHVAILSWNMWQKTFHGDPHVIGKEITFFGNPYPNGTTLTIVGVMSQNSPFPVNADIWVPLPHFNNSRIPAHSIEILCRLRPGVSAAVAQSTLTAALAAHGVSRLHMVSFLPGLLGPLAALLSLVKWACSAIALLVCCNVLVLALVRAKEQEKRLAIAAALGADHNWLGRQTWISVGTLTLIAVVASYGVEALTIHSISAQVHDVPAFITSRTSGWIEALSPALAAVCFLAWGWVPLLAIRRLNLVAVLGAERRPTPSVTTRRLLLALLGVELATTMLVLLLTTNGIFQYRRMWNEGLGKSWRDVYDFQLILPRDANRTYAALGTQLGLLSEHLNADPLRMTGALSAFLPTEPGPTQATIEATARTTTQLNVEAVSPDYFRVLDLPFLNGHGFSVSDLLDMNRGPSGPVIINHAAAHVLGYGVNSAIGRPLRAPGVPSSDIIIGVVKDNTIAGDHVPTGYIPLSDLGAPAADFTLHLLVRSQLPRSDIDEQTKRSVLSVFPSAQVDEAQPLPAFYPLTYTLVRLQNTFSIAMLIIVILASSIGVYGVYAWCAQIGRDPLVIRIAIGAGRLRATLGTFRHLIATSVGSCVLGFVLGLIGIGMNTGGLNASEAIQGIWILLLMLTFLGVILTYQLIALRVDRLLANAAK